MNRDQYLQKRGWRSPPAQLAAQAMQGDPASPAERVVVIPAAVLAVRPAPNPAAALVATDPAGQVNRPLPLGAN